MRFCWNENTPQIHFFSIFFQLKAKRFDWVYKGNKLLSVIAIHPINFFCSFAADGFHDFRHLVPPHVVSGSLFVCLPFSPLAFCISDLHPQFCLVTMSIVIIKLNCIASSCAWGTHLCVMRVGNHERDLLSHSVYHTSTSLIWAHSVSAGDYIQSY